METDQIGDPPYFHIINEKQAIKLSYFIKSNEQLKCSPCPLTMIP